MALKPKNDQKAKRFRETVDRVVRMLASKNVKVTQIGSRAYVTLNSDHSIATINIPMIQDDAPDELYAATRGFIDAKVSTALFSEPRDNAERSAHRLGWTGPTDGVVSVFNVIEEIRTEEMMCAQFDGSRANFNWVAKFVADNGLIKAVKAAVETTDVTAVFNMALGTYLKSLLGNPTSSQFLEEMGCGPIMKTILGGFPDLVGRIRRLSSTLESSQLAVDIMKYLTKEGDGEGEAESDPSKAPEEGEKGESGDSKSEDKSEDGETEDSKSEDEDEDESEGESKSESEDEDESESEDESEADKSDESDTEGEDSSGDDAGEDKGGDGDGDESESDVSGSPDGDRSAGDGEAGEADEDSSGEGKDQKVEAGEEEGSVGDITLFKDGQGTGTSRAPSVSPESVDAANIGDAVADILMASVSAATSSYRPFTREYDEIREVKADGTSEVHYMRSMVGKTVMAIQSRVRRALSAASFSAVYGGHRSGKINASALHRVSAGEDKVFSRKVEYEAAATAVTLLIDCSGSMGGPRIDTARNVGFAMSEVLGRLGISFEVLGFTSYFPGRSPNEDKIKHALRAEPNRRMFNRALPLITYVFKSFSDGFNNKTRARIANINKVALSDNVDGESLSIALNRIRSQPEKRKIIFVLSDGQPASSDIQTDFHTLRSHLKDTVTEAENSGVEIIAFGIQTQAVKDFYKKYFVVNDLSSLQGEVMRELEKTLIAGATKYR